MPAVISPIGKESGSRIERIGRTQPQPLVSIIVLNYNGVEWLEHCFESIRKQTIIEQIELMFVDNNSSDSSVETARGLLADFPMASIVTNSDNLGFCEGNNVGARVAPGKYLFFLNSDTWMEPDCMEKLVAEIEKADAGAGSPWVLNYTDDTHQDLGFFGFDIFGLVSASAPAPRTREVFSACGSAYFIRADVFKKVGMFDREFFMYSEEVDLSFRVQIAGYKIVGAPPAHVHHRGAANANPAGGAKVVEYRTTDKKRFLSNRNCMLTLLKNGQHIIALLAVPQMGLLLAEAIVGAVLLRRLSFAKATFVDVLRDCWRLRSHIWTQRRFIRSFRKRSDFWMLRFFRLRLNRWFEIKRLFKFGLPKVDNR